MARNNEFKRAWWTGPSGGPKHLYALEFERLVEREGWNCYYPNVDKSPWHVCAIFTSKFGYRYQVNFWPHLCKLLVEGQVAQTLQHWAQAPEAIEVEMATIDAILDSEEVIDDDE